MTYARKMKNLALATASLVLLSSCSTFNASGLQLRKRSRDHKEFLVTDFRALKTPIESKDEREHRKDVLKGKSKLDIIKRDPPPEGYVDPY